LKYHRVLYIPTAATFFRRRVFAEGNLLNQDLHYAMDFDFFVRIAAAGYCFKHVRAVLADVRLHPASKSCAKAELMLQERDSLMVAYSQISKRIRSSLLQKAAFSGAQTMAAVMRYTEKLARGHYSAQREHELLEI
jgi:Golgi nucleoside diphosphatase